MASNRWVGWALWQLGVFFLCHCEPFFSYCTARQRQGSSSYSYCRLHRDALCLASSPPCGFRQRSQCPPPRQPLPRRQSFEALFSSPLTTHTSHLPGTIGSFETGQMERLRAAWSHSPELHISVTHRTKKGGYRGTVWGCTSWVLGWSCGLRSLTQEFHVLLQKKKKEIVQMKI